MKKRFFLSAVTGLLLATACTHDDPELPVDETVTLKATFYSAPGQDARLWPQGARVSVNAREYAVSEGAGTAQARIDGVAKAEKYDAFWPAQERIAVAGAGLNFFLPEEQAYAGTDNPGPYAGVCGDACTLELVPLCGTLTFFIYGSGTITTVGLRADGGEPLSGPAFVKLVQGEPVEAKMLEGGENTLFLHSKEGVELTAKPVAFRLHLPPGTYAEGFTMIVVDDSGNQMNLRVQGPIDIVRGTNGDFEAIGFDPDEVVKGSVTLRLEASAGPDGRPDAIWRENDSVTINGEMYPIASGAGTKQAVVERVRQTSTFWASYPAAEKITCSAGKFSVSLSRTQTFDIAAPYCGPMVAYGGETTLELRYLCGMLRLSLTGSGTLYRLKLSGTGIVGDATADATADGIGELRMKTSEPGELTVNLPETGIALAAQPVPVYCVLPPGNYSDLKLTAIDSDGKEVEADIEGSVTIARGAVVDAAPIDLRFTGGGGEAVNLSTAGTANCYIVPGPGRYSFAAMTVRGTPIENIASVDWVWASRVEGSETNELTSDLAYTEGVVSFTASTRKGNVLVAALDAAGEILWSWHIWLTDDPRVDEMTYKCGKTFLDRNLGAVSAVPGGENTAGLLYQWGRKDPFVGGNGEEDTYKTGTEWTLAKEATVMNADYAWSTHYPDEGGTESYARAHPTELLGNYRGATWTAAPDSGLWAAAKTDSDPCPPGYRVPEIDFGTEISDGGWSAVPGLSDLFLTGSTYGLIYTCDGRTHFWPFAGQRWGDSDRGCYTNLNFVGCYWTISFSDAGKPYNFNIVENGTIWYNGDERWDTCHALSVRCCKE